MSTLLHKAGDKKAVEELQRFLLTYGFSTEEPDGVYGPKTRKAVKAFQKKLELTADGLVGPTTIKTMIDFGSNTPIPNTVEKPAPPPSITAPTPVTNVGSKKPTPTPTKIPVADPKVPTITKPKAATVPVATTTAPKIAAPKSAVTPRTSTPTVNEPLKREITPKAQTPSIQGPSYDDNPGASTPTGQVTARPVAEPAAFDHGMSAKPKARPDFTGKERNIPQKEPVSTDPATNTIAPAEPTQQEVPKDPQEWDPEANAAQSEPTKQTDPKTQQPEPKPNAWNSSMVAKSLVGILKSLAMAKKQKTQISNSNLLKMINDLKAIYKNGYAVLNQDMKLQKHFLLAKKNLQQISSTRTNLQNSIEFAAINILLESYKLNEAVEKPEDVPELVQGEHSEVIEIDPTVAGFAVKVKFYINHNKNLYYIIPQEDIDIRAKTYRKKAKVTLEELEKDYKAKAWLTSRWGLHHQEALKVCYEVLKKAKEEGSQFRTSQVQQQVEEERQARAKETVDEYYNMFKSVLDELGWTPDEMPSNEYMKDQYIAIGDKIKEIDGKLDKVKEQGAEMLGQIETTANELINDMTLLADLTVNYTKNLSGPQVGGTGPDYTQEQPGVVQAPVQQNVAKPIANPSS